MQVGSSSSGAGASRSSSAKSSGSASKASPSNKSASPSPKASDAKSSTPAVERTAASSEAVQAARTQASASDASIRAQLERSLPAQDAQKADAAKAADKTASKAQLEGHAQSIDKLQAEGKTLQGQIDRIRTMESMGSSYASELGRAKLDLDRATRGFDARAQAVLGDRAPKTQTGLSGMWGQRGGDTSTAGFERLPSSLQAPHWAVPNTHNPYSNNDPRYDTSDPRGALDRADRALGSVNTQLSSADALVAQALRGL